MVQIVLLTGKASTSKVDLVLSHERLIIYLFISRLIIRLTLRKENDLFYIAFQEDFYHTEVLSNHVIYGPHLH